MRSVSPGMIARAWKAFRGNRKGHLIGPGPGFVEALAAALAEEDREARDPERIANAFATWHGDYTKTNDLRRNWESGAKRAFEAGYAAGADAYSSPPKERS